jgi:hypothetical protein
VREPCSGSATSISGVVPTALLAAVVVAQWVPSELPGAILGMAQNFIECGREQAFLMPPSFRDWLPEDHLVWFVIESVGRLDLQPFCAGYRADGHGRAAYERSVMASVVLCAYSSDERSSRGMERSCGQDVAYRVITANQVLTTRGSRGSFGVISGH